MPPALEDRGTEPINGFAIPQVQRHQRRCRAKRLDLIIEVFQARHRTSNGNHMRAASSGLQSCCIAYTARCASDEDDLAGKVLKLSH